MPVNDELNQEVLLSVKCMVCERAKQYERCVPKYLVSGLIIGFHSSHEGHQLEIRVDSTVYLP
jgi:hypothetical protein